MSLGRADRQGNLLDEVTRFCDEVLPSDSVYSFLHREKDSLFPDEFFEDLFAASGRRSVPPSVVATVMVLQRLEGLSDREAVERYTFDNRFRYAAGVGGYDTGGWAGFAHTVLVDMRERLRNSERPNRVFEVALGAAKSAGLVGKRRVLDSTPLYDAVATMDTVTLIRSAIRGLLALAGTELQAKLRAAMSSGDDYATSAKPQIDWDDQSARDGLIDSRAKDAHACLALFEGANPQGELAEAIKLLATVVGQDLEQDDDGNFHIARKVIPDRVISTVDPQARHGHKSSSRGFDGYKGHAAIDPDSEIITATEVTPGNRGDASVAEGLIEDLIAGSNDDPNLPDAKAQGPKVYGDSAYGTGEFLGHLESNHIDSGCKTQPPTAAGGLFTKDRFQIDLEAQTVTCPAEITVGFKPGKNGRATAWFTKACTTCKLRELCTNSAEGRTITVGAHEGILAAARQLQKQPGWKDDYRANRPKVERKLAHLMRRKHGGRRARVRGKIKVCADFSLLAAATNLARLAVLGVHRSAGHWVAAN